MGTGTEGLEASALGVGFTSSWSCKVVVASTAMVDEPATREEMMDAAAVLGWPADGAAGAAATPPRGWEVSALGVGFTSSWSSEVDVASTAAADEPDAREEIRAAAAATATTLGAQRGQVRSDPCPGSSAADGQPGYGD
jgi:hypothetical protein